MDGLGPHAHVDALVAALRGDEPEAALELFELRRELQQVRGGYSSVPHKWCRELKLYNLSPIKVPLRRHLGASDADRAVAAVLDEVLKKDEPLVHVAPLVLRVRQPHADDRKDDLHLLGIVRQARELLQSKPRSCSASTITACGIVF